MYSLDTAMLNNNNMLLYTQHKIFCTETSDYINVVFGRCYDSIHSATRCLTKQNSLYGKEMQKHMATFAGLQFHVHIAYC